jgi:hypothetical protein
MQKCMQLTEAENVGQSHIKQFLMKPGVLSKIDLLTKYHWSTIHSS